VSDFDALDADLVAVGVQVADGGGLLLVLVFGNAPVGLVPRDVVLVLLALGQEEVGEELVDDGGLALADLVLLLAGVLALLVLVLLAVERAVVLLERLDGLGRENLSRMWSELESRQLFKLLN